MSIATEHDSRVHVGVIGAGAFGSLHIQTLAGLGEAKLTAVVDTNEAALAEIRSLLPDAPCFTSLDDALARSTTRAWVIATRTSSHIPLAKRLLDAGHHVLIEKPLAENLDQAQELAPLVRDDSTNVMMGHVVLFAPEFEALLDEVKSRGPIRYFHAVRHRPATLREQFSHENPFTLTMVHDLYLALALTGNEPPCAMTATMRPHPQGRFDVAMANLHWADGTWGALTASFLTPPGMSHDGYDRLEVFGDGWAATMHLNPQPLQVWADRATWPIALDIHTAHSRPSGWLAQQLRCFCQLAQGKTAVPLGARYQDGLTIMQWLDQLQAIALQSPPASTRSS